MSQNDQVVHYMPLEARDVQCKLTNHTGGRVETTTIRALTTCLDCITSA